MVIDLTGYIGKWPWWPNPYMDGGLDKFIELMDKSKIDKSVIVSTKSICSDDVAGNEEVFEAVEKYPEKLIASAAINPYSHGDNPAEYVNQCIERGAKLIRLYPIYHRYPLSREVPKLTQVVEQAISQNCPINIPIRLLMNWGFLFIRSGDVASFTRSFPDATFVIDAYNYPEFHPLLELAKECRNIYLGTMCLTMYKGIQGSVKAIGSKRLLFGTGMPLQYPACSLITVKEAEIEPSAKRNILSLNAKELLK